MDLYLTQRITFENSLPQGDRRLAAIMFTDMVGFTALGQRNEALSLALVEEQRKLIRPIITKHNGREVKTIGDALLVVFSSALDAARCAYDIQRALREYNTSVSEEEKIHLRIGIHLGDVVEEAGDIFGDAVNIASRIEPIAEKGGICLTRQVYDQIHNKFDLPLESLGIRSLKNVETPLEVYKVIMSWDEEKALEKERPDRSRVAVLPFVNFSPDPDDQYFSDGLTEELISKLSLVKGLKVIARTSTMRYKNKEKGIKEIGKELGVGSIVEGSVRKAGNRIRVTAQLIDAVTEEHLWSSSYSKTLDDIFEVQTDLATNIAQSLPGNLSPQISPASTGDTNNLTAYSYYLRAKQLINETTADSLRKALELLNSATKLDPIFARAYIEIANCYARLGMRSYISREEGVAAMKRAAETAKKLNDNLGEVHALLSFIGWADDDFTKAEEEAKKAIELNPNLSDAFYWLGMLKATIGYPKSAIKSLEAAHSLDPLSAYIVSVLVDLYIGVGMEEKALELWEKNHEIMPLVVATGMFEYYLSKGNLVSAEEKLEQIEALAPGEFNTIFSRGELCALKGDRAGAQEVIELLEGKFRGGGSTDRSIGYIKYFLGDLDGFFAAMFRAVDEHVLDPLQMRYSPLFERARKDPRFQELLKKNGLDPDIKE
ncbi:MAG: hypothetical protein JRN68_08190 [Nitrososphaerota archaeon]|jgi:TolB-like protein|nr:hypothetical protein [Nitrososphaerota archaeon]